MKNTIKIFSLFVVVAFASCKKEELVMPTASSSSAVSSPNMVEKDQVIGLEMNQTSKGDSIPVSSEKIDGNYVNAPKSGGNGSVKGHGGSNGGGKIVVNDAGGSGGTETEVEKPKGGG